MADKLLEVKDLCVSVDDKLILDGINITVNKGETHVLMGQNGTGKSTLVSTIMGDPRYTVNSGKIIFDGEDITDESADKRAKKGLFMSFQNPHEVPGITLMDFLRTSRGALNGKIPGVISFKRELDAMMEELEMDKSYAKRYLNVGFSGGEKKKTEILQMLMSKPKLALLDETDSGLDVDAVRTVSKGIDKYCNSDNAVIIITHSSRILDALNIDKVHVLGNKKLLKTGGAEIIAQINENGFKF